MADESGLDIDPRTGRRETLTARSKRIIGKTLDEGSEAAPSNDRQRKSPTRRREQILQAQRTHRQRTQRYIQELEKEVLRLRESETELRQHNDELLSQIKTLKQALAASQLTVPFDDALVDTSNSEFSEDLSGTNGSYANSYHHDQSQGQEYSFEYNSPVRVDLTELGIILPERACSIKGAEAVIPYTQPDAPVRVDLTELSSVSPHAADPTHSVEEATPYTQPLSRSSQGYNSPNGMSTDALSTRYADMLSEPALMDTQSAIDFVLRLERPCLPHVKNAYLMQHPNLTIGTVPYNSGPNHSFMVTSTIVHNYRDRDPAAKPMEITAGELEKLFQMSQSLNLEYDLTPIQIWSALRERSAQRPISVATLKRLVDEFAKYVRCCGYSLSSPISGLRIGV